MHDFRYVRGRLHCEGASIEALAKQHGSPLYVYSSKTLSSHFNKLDRALAPLDHLICFAMKSNSNLGVMRTLADLGSGFDTVSGGEIQRAIAAGGNPRKCVFAGVGKTEEEITFALRKGIYSFNVESEPELTRINRIAGKLKKTAPVAIRVNPNVDAKTHKKITTGTYENKFGIAFEKIPGVYARATKLKNIKLLGLQMHIGSQLTQVKPFKEAVRKVTPLAAKLKAKHGIEFLSIGGGLGIMYEDALASGDSKWWNRKEAKNILTPEIYAAALVPLLEPLGLKVLLEPGRFISGNAGILVSRVEYVKRTGKKYFAIVDAAMNDLIRPAFYESYHEIIPVKQSRNRPIATDVVGGICETGDTFCKNRLIPRIEEGDLVAMLSAGAYGFVMAGTYNTRPLPAEVLVAGKKAAIVRKRQKVKEIWEGESLAPWQG
jgi:diaminopimelate decarboxylase